MGIAAVYSPALAELPQHVIKASLDMSYYDKDHRALRSVESQINVFNNTIKDRFELYLMRSGRFLGMMKEIFRRKGLPEDLVYVSLIESGFNPRAYSPKKAAGPWQFIESTGRLYGLKVNYWVDERRDPIKSTRAAAEHLSDLYERFQSWDLAIAAYNGGAGRIRKALRRTKGEDFWDLHSSRHLRRETRNFVPKFLAAKLIAQDPVKYGFTDLDYYDRFVFDKVVLGSPTDLKVVARCSDTTLQDIKELNPELRRWSTPHDVSKYSVRIPEGASEIFQACFKDVSPKERLSARIYWVKKGDTLSEIASRAGIRVSTILRLNSIRKKSLLRIGQRLYLPPV